MANRVGEIEREDPPLLVPAEVGVLGGVRDAGGQGGLVGTLVNDGYRVVAGLVGAAESAEAAEAVVGVDRGSSRARGARRAAADARAQGRGAEGGRGGKYAIIDGRWVGRAPRPGGRDVKHALAHRPPGR